MQVKPVSAKAAIALMVITGMVNTAHAQASTSPHNFVAPQCTWGADWTAYLNGWNLQFSGGSRDAAQWWWKVTNAGHSNAPAAGRIAVFDSPGHVAYVTSYKGDGWNWTSFTVYHSNWPLGSRLHYDTFVNAGNGYVKMQGGTTKYHILGFLYR